MNSTTSQKRLKKTRSWTTHFGAESSDSQGDIKLSSLNTYSKNYKIPIIPEFCIFRSEDNRDQLHRASTDYSLHKKTKSNVTNETKVKKHPNLECKTNSIKSPEKCKKKPKLQKDQDEIIYIQNSLIEEMKNEINKLQSEVKFSEDSTMNERSLRNENRKLRKKIENLKKDYELDLIKIKEGIERKDEIAKELTIGLKMKIEAKKVKISNLKQRIEDIREENLDDYETSSKKTIEELKQMVDSEAKIKLVIEDELFALKLKEKTLIRDNTVLIKNYQDMQNKCSEVEGKLISIADAFSHRSIKYKDDSINID